MRIFYTLVLIVSTFQLFAQAPSFDWSRGTGANTISYAKDVVTDSTGNIYAVGHFVAGSITFGNITLNNSNGGNQDGYVVKYDPNGNALWAKSISSDNQDLVNTIAIDKNNDLIIGGTFYGTILHCGNISLPQKGNGDGFVVKLDNNGNFIWGKSFLGIGYEYVNDVSVDSLNNVYVSGQFFSDTLSSGNLTLISNTFFTPQMFVSKISSLGNVQWLKHYGVGNYQSANASYSFNGNNVMIVGHDEYDIFIANVDSLGNLIWSKTLYGDPQVEMDEATEIVSDGSGNFYITGYFVSTTINFDSIPFTGYSGKKGFLFKCNQNGNISWIRALRGNGDSECSGLNLSPAGKILVAGHFTSTHFYPDVTDTLDNQSYLSYSDSYICNYDTSGAYNWSELFGSIYHDDILSITSDQQNRFVICGAFTSSFLPFNGTFALNNNTGNEAMFVAKSGQVITTKMNSNNQGAIEYYPNPVNNILTIKSVLNSTVQIKNLLGELVYSKSNCENTEQIIMKDYPIGLYFLTINNYQVKIVRE
jgi:hypothetical protein